MAQLRHRCVVADVIRGGCRHYLQGRGCVQKFQPICLRPKTLTGLRSMPVNHAASVAALSASVRSSGRAAHESEETKQQPARQQFEVGKSEHKMPIAKFLQSKGMGNMEVRRAIKAGRVWSDSKKVSRTQFFVKIGQVISVSAAPEAASKLKGSQWDERIVYEDAALVVVNKPPGFTSLPSDNDGGQSVLSQVEKYLRGREASKWPVPQRLLPLHRLDKDTSGVLMFCKKKEAVDAVTRQFRSQSVNKRYFAVARGCIDDKQAADGTITWKDTLVMRKGKASVLQRPEDSLSVDPSRLKEAITDMRVVRTFERAEATLVEFFPRTGRTHQLRVQSMSRGHALLGDDIYAPFSSTMKSTVRQANSAASRLALHCSIIELEDPLRVGKVLRLQANLPQDLQQLLRQLEEMDAAA